MPDPVHFLTTPERDLVQRVVDRVRHLFGTDPAGFPAPDPISQSSSIFVARLPDNQSLPAFNDTTKVPGFKACDIYKVNSDSIGTGAVVQKMEHQSTVFNIYRLPIIGVAADNEYYFQVFKHATGRWLCERPVPLIAKNLTGSDITAGSLGTVTIFRGPRGSEVTTGVTVSAFNRTTFPWENGKFGGVDLYNGLVYGFPWVVGDGGGGADVLFITFSTTSAFASSEATADVVAFWGGSDPGLSITVVDYFNDLAGQGSGITGIAVFNPTTNKFPILKYTLKSLLNFNSSFKQALIHDGAPLQWFNIGPCTGPT